MTNEQTVVLLDGVLTELEIIRHNFEFHIPLVLNGTEIEGYSKVSDAINKAIKKNKDKMAHLSGDALP